VIRHLVTDRRRFGLDADRLVARVAAAATHGIDVVQIRERDLSDRALVSLVRAMRAALDGAGARVVVNDRADVALAAGAAGVHLPSDSVPASRIRRIVPSGFTIGRSVHSLAEIDDAVRDGACDYLIFGTVFPSAGKGPGHPVAGIDGLAAACRRATIPVIAIGGMSDARAAEIAAAGAAGLAAVGMVR
jgi:thiamine-phosphate pyrophosphorylase